MLFLQHYARLSDVQVAEQVRYNLLYRKFVGLSVDDETPDDTTLVVFRQRLGAERFQALFDAVVQQCRRHGYLQGKLKLVDATHVLADVAIPNTVTLLRQARARVLRAVRRVNGQAARELEGRYLNEQRRRGRASEEELVQEVELSRELAGELKDRKLGPKVARELELLERVLDPEEKIASVVDPEARWGFKRENQPFLGYKVQTSSDQGSQIVTSLEVLPGQENECVHLTCLLERDRAKGIHHVGLAADAQYDSGPNRRSAKEEFGLEAYIPDRMPRRHLDDFVYDPELDRVTCPAGKASVGKTRQERGYLHYFSATNCRSCPLQDACAPLRNMHRVRVFVSDSQAFQRWIDRRRFREAMKARRQSEGIYGSGKKWLGLGRARYRGLEGMTI